MLTEACGVAIGDNYVYTARNCGSASTLGVGVEFAYGDEDTVETAMGEHPPLSNEPPASHREPLRCRTRPPKTAALVPSLTNTPPTMESIAHPEYLRAGARPNPASTTNTIASLLLRDKNAHLQAGDGIRHTGMVIFTYCAPVPR